MLVFLVLQEAKCGESAQGVVEHLVNSGADPNVLTGQKSRCLSDMEETEKQIAKYYQHGAKVNMFHGETFPPLHLAVMRNSPAMVEYLLKAGADINCSHTSGLTALGMACLTEHGSKICCFDLNKISGLRFAFGSGALL